MARILIVDDEDGIRKVLRQLLEYEGHEVRTASGGGEAIGVFEEFEPDVTFLDVKMARMDGLEVLMRLRAIDPDAIIMIAATHDRNRRRGHGRGAYDFSKSRSTPTASW